MRLIIVATISLGLTFAILSQHQKILHLLMPKANNSLQSSEALATVTVTEGKTFFKNAGDWVRASEETQLMDRTQLKTEFGSKLKIRTVSGDVIEVEPRSHIVIEKWRNETTLISIKSGQIFVQQMADASKTMIYQKLQVTSLRDFSPEPAFLTIKQSPTPSPTEPTAAPASQSISQADDAGENIKAIQKVMAQQKFWLDKCYAGFLKKNPKGKGEIKIFFSLDEQGRVTEAETHSSTFNDKVIESCVVQTVTRTRFADYKGETRQFIFPFQFNRQ